MNLDKRTIAGVSGILVFTLVLGISSAAADKNAMFITSAYGIQSSAGANAAINDNGQTTVAGAMGAVDETIGVVDTDNNLVGQGAETSNKKYKTYGYKNLGMAVVEGNLNVRKKASTDASIVGKMTNNAACEIIGEKNGFYKIESGNVKGYVSKDYIITGEEALKRAQKEARDYLTVTTSVLRVREEPTTDSDILSKVNKGEKLAVVEEVDGWVKVEVNDLEGYVSADYVKIKTELKTGNTMKELNYGSGISNTRVDLVNYALQFVGNPYVWGGTSLTNGTDCSGFTMRIYQRYGIYLPHSSRAQPNHGTKISRDQIRPGDLIFYGNGRSINHVAIYMGNGQVVHASNARDGIKISNAFYRTPVCIVSYLP